MSEGRMTDGRMMEGRMTEQRAAGDGTTGADPLVTITGDGTWQVPTGQEKTGRQVTVSTDLIYDVLRRHEPDHILLRAARADAEALPFADGSFDLVLGHAVLHHLPNLRRLRQLMVLNAQTTTC